ncbi:MAG TPA: SMC family ATPase [archaeon]|jgi:exonuclease SbcC|nr:SMC family ATPase [archaeon]
MLKSLKLENWKTHHNSIINFSKGTNIFVGKIGAGKSSIVDAICFALYGTYPALQTKKLTISETIMFKPVKKDFSKITLIFEYENNEYKIEREIFTEKTNNAKLYLNDRLVAGPKQTDVNEKVSDILGIDYNLFIKIVYSEQNEIDYFLKIAPGKRKEQFDSLFGISNLENIKVNSRELSRLISFDKEKNTVLYKQITEQISAFNYSEIELQLKSLITEKEKIINQISEQITLKQTLEQEYKKIKEKKQIYENKITEKNILEAKQKEIVLQIKDDFKISDNVSSLKEKKIILEQEIKEIEEENKKVILMQRNLENQRHFYLEQQDLLNTEQKALELKKIQLDINKINAEKTELELKISEMQLNIAEKTAIINDLKKSIIELKKGFSNCPVCDSKLSKEQITLKLNEKQNQEKQESTQLLNLNDILKQQLTRKEELKIQEKKAQENEIVIQKILEIEKKKENFNKTIQELNLKVKELPEKKDTQPLQDQYSNTIALLEQYQLIEKKKEIESKLDSLNRAILDLNYSEENYLILYTDYKNLETKFEYLKSQEENLKKQEENLKGNVERYTKLKEDENKIKIKLDNLDKHLQNVSYFTLAAESSQNNLRTVLVNNINKTLELIWPKVYPYTDYISARLKAENDYVLEVQTLDNNWIRVEGLLSGGERTCAALSIRVAIALSLTKKLGLLILDEPTHNLDTKTIANISIILEKDLPELVDQIFIVTHDSKLLDAVNSSKYIIERDKENDGVSKIIEG